MNNEFYLKYNLLRDYKYDNFDKYTKDLVSAYSKLETSASAVSSNENLAYAWRKILSSMDKVIEKRDNIDSWWTNYLENIRRLEQGLPDQVASISKYNVHQYATEHSVGSAPTVEPTIYEPTPVSAPASDPTTVTGTLPPETVSTPAITGTPISASEPQSTPNEIINAGINSDIVTGETTYTAPEPTPSTPGAITSEAAVSTPATNGIPLTRQTADGEVTINPNGVLSGAVTAKAYSGGYASADIETLD